MAEAVRRTRRRRTSPCRDGVDIVVTFPGLDWSKDRAIRRALGKYETGSGFAVDDRQRDHTATVPPDALARVLKQLKTIRGIRTRRLVQKWVLCR